MSIFTKIWGDVKWLGKTIGHLFAADILPFAIEATQKINEAVKSGEAQQLVDVLKGLYPGAGQIGQAILDEAQVLGPKVLSTELGLQALETSNTPQADIAFAQSVIDAYGSADLIKQSKTWNSLATQLTILYDQGKTQDKTWMDWAGTVEQGFKAIQQAIADQKAADDAATE